MKDKLTTECNVEVRATNIETGEIISRVGHNVWTNAGREYDCLLKTYNIEGQAYRNDRIGYIGLGTGTQPETVNVTRLAQPAQWQAGVFLKQIAHTATSFQTIDGVRTAVRYRCRLVEQDVNVGESDIVLISECGLFTDGNALTFEAGGRDVSSRVASQQVPVAYHTFDPIPKTPSIQLEIIWELRH